MRCHKAQRLISGYIDGSLETGKAAGLEQHVRKCAACRQLLEDLRTIAAAAPSLDGPEPSEAVWSRIRTRLMNQETVASEGRAPAPGLRALGWSASALKFAGAAAITLILIASGVFFGIRIGKKGVSERAADPEKYTLAKLDEAEHYYRQAIKSLSEAFAGQKGTMIPAAAEMFEKNLAIIDDTIQACRQAVLKEPDDLQARNYLLAAYMDKVTVLDTALEFSGKNPAAVKRGTTI
jgi:formiminotetrahydrofolate cyclodeaminase